ncbi:MAG: BppU family phage baseplate upper protein [Acutalibacteraceae bacterium]|nr:BppU family phage baseplate upper protein [Acutalibacteraceae bacterium]
METEYKIYAYEKNHIEIFAVQGEKDSRTIIFDIVEKTGNLRPTSNAPVTDQMLDLTGYDASLYGVYADGSCISCSGTISSTATDGKVSFTLPQQFCLLAEKLDCAVVLTSRSNELRIVGITLTVSPCDLTGGDPAVKRPQPIAFYLGTTYPLILTLIDEDGDPYDLASGESLILTVAATVSGTAVITKTVSANDGTSGEYAFEFAASDTSELSAGMYTYKIMLTSSTLNLPIVIPSPFELLAI